MIGDKIFCNAKSKVMLCRRFLPHMAHIFLTLSNQIEIYDEKFEELIESKQIGIALVIFHDIS